MQMKKKIKKKKNNQIKKPKKIKKLSFYSKILDSKAIKIFGLKFSFFLQLLIQIAVKENFDYFSCYNFIKKCKDFFSEKEIEYYIKKAKEMQILKIKKIIPNEFLFMKVDKSNLKSSELLNKMLNDSFKNITIETKETKKMFLDYENEKIQILDVTQKIKEQRIKNKKNDLKTKTQKIEKEKKDKLRKKQILEKFINEIEKTIYLSKNDIEEIKELLEMFFEKRTNKKYKYSEISDFEVKELIKILLEISEDNSLLLKEIIKRSILNERKSFFFIPEFDSFWNNNNIKRENKTTKIFELNDEEFLKKIN